MSVDSQDEADEYKINTVIAARRAFERSEDRERQRTSTTRRRQTDRDYESPGQKYCPCCRDKISTAILLCNSGLMTVTSQIAVICTIFIATTGLNVVPGGLVAIFLLTCFAISIFGLCGIIGPIRKTFSVPPLEGAQKASSNFCILSYMVANLVVLVIFFVSLCVCLSFLSRSGALRSIRSVEVRDLDIAGQWMEDFATQPDYRDDWKEYQEFFGCCGFYNTSSRIYNETIMPSFCNETIPMPEACYYQLLETLWENLSLLSGIMGFLFILQLMAAGAACQLLCCAQKRNHFTAAAEVAVKKLGIAMEAAREDIQEDEVLLDTDYSSSEEEDEEEDDGDAVGTGHQGQQGDYDDGHFDGDGLYDEPGSDDSITGHDYNITQRSSGPDSSDEEEQRSSHRQARRAPGKHQSKPSQTSHKTGTRASTYAVEMTEVVLEEDGESDRSGQPEEGDSDGKDVVVQSSDSEHSV